MEYWKALKYMGTLAQNGLTKPFFAFYWLLLRKGFYLRKILLRKMP